MGHQSRDSTIGLKRDGSIDEAGAICCVYAYVEKFAATLSSRSQVFTRTCGIGNLDFAYLRLNPPGTSHVAVHTVHCISEISCTCTMPHQSQRSRASRAARDLRASANIHAYSNEREGFHNALLRSTRSCAQLRTYLRCAQLRVHLRDLDT